MYLKRILWFSLRCRFKTIRDLVWKLVKPKTQVFSPSDFSLRILVGGDVSLDPEIRITPYLGAYALNDNSDQLIQAVPHPYGHIFSRQAPKRRPFLNELCSNLLFRIPRRYLNYVLIHLARFFLLPGFHRPKPSTPFWELLVRNCENQRRMVLPSLFEKFIRFNIKLESDKSIHSYPFEKISTLLKTKDLVLVNLETPLTNHGRAYGVFLSDPRYAQAMKNAGISAVTLANNHIFDAGEIGFLETMDHLKSAGIDYFGVGANFQDARSGKIIEVRGIRIRILCYTQCCNTNLTSIAADYPGILPLDRKLMVEDIKAAKGKSDFLFVSLHWGIENDPIVHPKQIEIAHLLIDSGADLIIGHHSHVPQGIEVYKKKPILYSIGNFIFAQGDTRWHSDNILVEIVIENNRIRGLIIYPISGQGQELFQPELLSGARAESLLNDLQIKSSVFRTGIAVQNHIGYIGIQ